MKNEETETRTNEELEKELLEGQLKQAGAVAFCLKFVAETAATDPQRAEKELDEVLTYVNPLLLPLVEVVRGHIWLMRKTRRSHVN